MPECPADPAWIAPSPIRAALAPVAARTAPSDGLLRVGGRAARYAPGRGEPVRLEVRLAALEARIEEVAADAAAARHLAAARDRDLADFGVRVDANRSAINALSVQTAGRFDQLENDVRAGFTEMRGKLDQAAAGQQQIVELLTGLISPQDDQ